MSLAPNSVPVYLGVVGACVEHQNGIGDYKHLLVVGWLVGRFGVNLAVLASMSRRIVYVCIA